MLRRVGSSLTCGLCLISLCAIARPALAQTLTDEHAWTGVALQGRLAKASPWRWLAEGQLRTRNESRDEDQLIERAALSRDLPAHVNLVKPLLNFLVLLDGFQVNGFQLLLALPRLLDGGLEGRLVEVFRDFGERAVLLGNT